MRPADLRVRSLEVRRKADPREMVAFDTEPGLRSALRALSAAQEHGDSGETVRRNNYARIANGTFAHPGFGTRSLGSPPPRSGVFFARGKSSKLQRFFPSRGVGNFVTPLCASGSLSPGCSGRRIAAGNCGVQGGLLSPPSSARRRRFQPIC